MSEINKTAAAIAFFEAEETFYMEMDDTENAVHCGRAIIALEERKQRLLRRQGDK